MFGFCNFVTKFSDSLNLSFDRVERLIARGVQVRRLHTVGGTEV